MQRVYDLIARVAPTSSTVLIVGETGTGKELVAETIHQLSRRSSEPFIPMQLRRDLADADRVRSCSVTSAELHRRRAASTRGIFERAHGGTLFLDEITRCRWTCRLKLSARILETGALTRVGGDRATAVDVRSDRRDENRDPAQGGPGRNKLREDPPLTG